jgi:hypothetical protein
MLDLSSISLDPNSGSNGKWFNFFGDAKLKLASSDNPAYKGALAKLAREHRVELDDANPDQYDTITSITCQALARFVLLDWKNISVGNKETPYSQELGAVALKESPKLYEFVTAKAGDISHFSQSEIEEAKKQ